MNKISRRLLSGASLAALGFALPVTAAKAGITVNTGAHPAISILFPAATSFIKVTNGGVVDSNGFGTAIFNSGFVGSFGQAIAINVTGTGSVDGDIVNSGVIEANFIGVHVGVSAVVDGALNNGTEGIIAVANNNTGGFVAGVLANNTFLGGINNEGDIGVSGVAIGGGGSAYGIDVYAPGQNPTEVTFITNGGEIDVKQFASANFVIGARAVGIQATITSNLDVGVFNDGGVINASATAVNAFTAKATATAIKANALLGDASVDVFNSGTIHAHALATNAFSVNALAIGVNVGAGGSIQGEVINDGLIAVTALAVNAFGANAEAVGIKVAAGSAPNSATVFEVVNSSVIAVKAEAGLAFSGHANAVGIWVDPSGDVSVHNHGTMFVTAIATGLANAKASATGAKATAAGGVFDNANVDNDGNLIVFAGAGAIGTAVASAIGLKAHASNAFSTANANATNLTGGVITAVASADALNANANAAGLAASAEKAFIASAHVNNDGTLNVLAFASNFFVGITPSTAHALAIGEAVNAQSATFFAEAHAFNDGAISVAAIASASGGKAVATAVGMEAFAHNALIAGAGVTNDANGAIKVTALAQASAKGTATAIATGMLAKASNAFLAGANAFNSGSVHVAALGHGFTAENVQAFGMKAIASSASDAAAFAENSGNVTASAHANATPGFIATIASALAAGVVAEAFSAADATATAINNKDIKAVATASGFLIAHAEAVGLAAIATSGAFENHAHATNNGKVSATAYAFDVFALTGFAEAIGIAAEVGFATGSGTAVARNHGIDNVTAFASGFTVLGEAEAIGVLAEAFSMSGHMSAIASNTEFGDVHVGALVQVSGLGDAIAIGMEAEAVSGKSDAFARAFNSGHVFASAYASTAAVGVFAKASAAGVVAAAGNVLGAATAEATNEGVVTAKAQIFEFGTAIAVGMLAENFSDGTSNAYLNNNGGEVIAEAVAFSGKAEAVGMEVRADQYHGEIYNSGFVFASAVGSTASATGIKVTNNGGPIGGAGQGFIVNNGGAIIAVANGVRGNAIDVTGAPNGMAIDLEGSFTSGYIYGNIRMEAGASDSVNVFDGDTFFDGIIDPGHKAGDLYEGALNVGTVGGLASEAGTLTFASNTFEGNAQAWVNDYRQRSNGTIALEVTPFNNAASNPAFVYIHASNATLGGTARVDLAPALYASGERWRVVIDDGAANTPIVGHWATVLVGDGSSLFLSAHEQDVQGGVDVSFATSHHEADIVLARAAFNSTAAVPSLAHNENEMAVATGLENSVAGLGTGPCGTPYACMIQALEFFPGSESDFQALMDLLSGEEYGELAMADLDAADHLKDSVSAHLQAVFGGPGQMTDLSTPDVTPANGGDMHGAQIWGGAFGRWGKTDTTVAGPGFDQRDSGLTAGADIPVDSNTRLGAAFAWTAHGSLDFNNGNTGRYDGFQVGAYGRYNQDAYYLQGLASYGSYSDSARRTVFIPLFGLATERGSYNSHVWTVYGEGGWHLNAGNDLDLVPYVALDYLHGSSSSFTEHGTPGPMLHVASADATSFSSFLGVKASLMDSDVDGMSLVPTVKVAWQHEFDTNIWTVNANFAGIPASAFQVTGEGLSRDSLVAGAELAINLGDNVDAALSYDGRFSSDRQINSVLGRVNFKF